MVLLIVLNAVRKPYGLKNPTRCEDAGTAGQPAENESYGVCGETECLKTAIKVE